MGDIYTGLGSSCGTVTSKQTNNREHGVWTIAVVHWSTRPSLLFSRASLRLRTFRKSIVRGANAMGCGSSSSAKVVTGSVFPSASHLASAESGTSLNQRSRSVYSRVFNVV